MKFFPLTCYLRKEILRRHLIQILRAIKIEENKYKNFYDILEVSVKPGSLSCKGKKFHGQDSKEAQARSVIGNLGARTKLIFWGTFEQSPSPTAIRALIIRGDQKVLPT